MTLDAPQVGYPNDDVGRSVALVIDCYSRKRVVYSRNVSTDPTPDSGLSYGFVDANGLTDITMLPLLGVYDPINYDLSFRVDDSGKEHIGVMASSLGGPILNYVHR